jgi:site-specific recombinase XerD
MAKGVFEKVPGSGVWWIRYIDAEGKLRREKACSKSAAIQLVRNRKTEAWEGKKLPKLRTRVVRFAELADDYLEYAQANNQGAAVDKYRIATLRAAFGDQVATIAIADLRKWFDKQEWEPGTFNRCRTVLRLIYKIGIENKKIDTNPADLLKHRKEPDGKARYLSADEEARLRKAILVKFPRHLCELEIALATGMRAGEQYDRVNWSCVDFLRRDLFVPTSKNGYSRHIALNAEALAAF